MSGPKPLIFGNDKPVDLTKVDDFHPLPLTFDDMVEQAKTQRQDIKITVPVKKLDFANNAASSVPAKKQPPTEIFSERNPFQTIINNALQYAKTNFDALKTELPSIERQIKQLLPLKADIIVTWGSAALEQEANLSLQIAQTIKQIVSVDANQIMDKIITTISSCDDGILSKLFGIKKDSPLVFKAPLIATISHLKQFIPSVEQFMRSTSASETRIMIQLVALIATREVVGASKDERTERAIFDRRTILQQAATQAKLARMQLEHTQTAIVDQLSRADQILNVTLPAYELAQVHKIE